MRRKLLLPALLACSMLAISAPVAPAASAAKTSKAIALIRGVQKAVKGIIAVNDGQTAAIHGVDTRVDSLVGQIATIKAIQDAIVAGVPDIKAALVTLGDAATKLKAGLETLAAGVQGPNAAGQLAAAGTAAPGNSNAATPSALPTGTVYRQIVLSTSAPFPAGSPIGARTWIRMPDVAALGYSNTYVCTSAGTTGAAAGSYTVTCSGGT